jgi:hypothetical protein
MKSFELPKGTQAKLVKATPHKEFAGPDMIQAISLRLKATLSLRHLVQINPALPGLFVRRREDADVQKPVDGVEPIVLELVAPEMTLPLALEPEFTGYTVVIDRAMGDIELYGAKVSKIKVAEIITQGEDGLGVIEWSVGSDERITPELVGMLCGMEAGDVWLGQTAPANPAEATAAKKHKKKQEALEAQGQQRIDGGGGGREPSSGPATPEKALASTSSSGGTNAPNGETTEPVPGTEGGAPETGSGPDAAAAQANKDRLDASGRSPFPNGGAKTDDEVKGETGPADAPKGRRARKSAVHAE